MDKDGGLNSLYTAGYRYRLKPYNHSVANTLAVTRSYGALGLSLYPRAHKIAKKMIVP
jgi:hypothetical protein